MRARQVLHVDVVADAGAVGRVVVVAEDGQGRPPAERGVDRERDEVDLGIVVLAERAVGMAAGGVEVAQGDRPQHARRGEVLEGALEGPLALRRRD